MIEEFVKKYGEENRALIVDALKWLEKKELEWQLPIDKEIFIEDLLCHYL
jgi:hypothetical protein